jgi:transposase InsO family protein
MVSIRAAVAAHACTQPCEPGPSHQPWPGRTADAPAWHSRSGPAPFPTTTDSRHQLPIAPNLLQQKFTASVPNRVWLADITYIPTGEGWLYLAAVLDLATRKVVGWAMRDHMRT